MDCQRSEAGSIEFGRISGAAAGALLLACAVVFVPGCDQTRGPRTVGHNQGDMAPVQAEAFEIVMAGLSDPTPLIRANAIEVVATTYQVKLMRTVESLLKDEWMPVRFAAAVAIGDLQYSVARTSIQQALKDSDTNVVIAASYAMGRLGYGEYYEVVRKALLSKDQTVRANAAFLLGRAGDAGALELLIQTQQDRDSGVKVRFQVLEARARLGDERVLSKLWSIVLSGYADDRITGVRAMGTLGTRQARDILITKLDDDVLEVRLAVAEQLGKLGDKTGEPEVLAVFEKDLTADMDDQARTLTNTLTALAIGQICTPELTKHLPELMKSESKSVRLAAAKAVFLCAAK